LGDVFECNACQLQQKGQLIFFGVCGARLKMIEVSLVDISFSLLSLAFIICSGGLFAIMELSLRDYLLSTIPHHIFSLFHTMQMAL